MSSSSFPLRLIGMVHLLPLPGSPGHGGSREAVHARAIEDARMLVDAGFDALLMENYGDAPFRKDAVEPSVIAEMAVIADDLQRMFHVPLGIQVLRNDARAALSIAAAVGAAFIRVNVHTGAMLTDQGVIEGRADETLRLRAQLDARVRIFADVMVKHAVPLAPQPIEDAARDAVQRGLADGVIVSGIGTGMPTSETDLVAVRQAVHAPVFVGSGAGQGNAAALLRIADGLIVGTAVKQGGCTTAPVDPARAAAFVRAALG
jgi:membrane complex biogenesis BtpA family protein